MNMMPSQFTHQIKVSMVLICVMFWSAFIFASTGGSSGTDKAIKVFAISSFMFIAAFHFWVLWRNLEQWLELRLKSATPHQIQERLTILDQLLAANAITSQEHAQRRAQIISGI